MRSKLCSGGGEGVNHSSVLPRHGSGPAGRPRRTAQITLTTVRSTPAPSTNEPMVDTTLYPSSDGDASEYSAMRRGIPESPAECCGRNATLNPMTVIQNESLPSPSDIRRPDIFGNQ